jgi:hypothetical protein
MFRHRVAILREYCRSKEYKSVYYTARHDTLHAVHTDDIPSLAQRPRQITLSNDQLDTQILIHLLQCSTCTRFEQYLAHPQEVKLY